MIALRSLNLLTAVATLATLATLRPARADELPNDDPDAESDNMSLLWTSALDPERRALDATLAAALRLYNDNDANAALQKLQSITTIAGDNVVYWRLHGALSATLRDWPTCVQSFTKVFAKLPSDVPPLRKGDTDEVHYAACLIKQGRLDDAEQVLQRVINQVPTSAEQWRNVEPAWLLHGELCLELGRISDAAAAFKTLAEGLRADGTMQAGNRARWWLAMTLDRMGRTVRAQKLIAELAADQQREVLAPRIPALFEGNDAYLRGLAAAATARNLRSFGVRTYYAAGFETAIAAFRDFLQWAPNSPWRGRADEHINSLLPKLPTRVGLHSVIEKKPGTLDAQIRSLLPALQQCVVTAPRTVFRVIIVGLPARVIKPAPTTLRKPTVFDLPAGRPDLADGGEPIAVSIDYPGDTLDATTTAAMFSCLSSNAQRIVLPPATEPGVRQTVTFAVIAAGPKAEPVPVPAPHSARKSQ